MDVPADSREVSLGIPAKPEYLVLVRLALSAVCRLTPLGPDEVADEERELSRAIIEATVDRFDEAGDSTLLVKQLAAAPG
jgi:hypothetical protein